MCLVNILNANAKTQTSLKSIEICGSKLTHGWQERTWVGGQLVAESATSPLKAIKAGRQRAKANKFSILKFTEIVEYSQRESSWDEMAAWLYNIIGLCSEKSFWWNKASLIWIYFISDISLGNYNIWLTLVLVCISFYNPHRMFQNILLADYHGTFHDTP